MDVGERIRQLRKEKNLSQNKLADMANVSQTHLRRVELGQADITIGHLRLVCDILGTTLKDFFDVESSPDELNASIANLTPKQKQLLIAFLKSL